MAYNALNNLIDAYIYANGVQAITGQILNGVLKQMVSQLGSGYHLMGVAGPETVPASNDYAMAYFAATAGEYTDFGGITLAAGEVAVLLTSGNGSWSKETIYNVPTGTADLENTANFITNAVTDLVNYYTKTEIDEQNAITVAALADRYTKSETDTKLGDYYKKTETYDKDEVDSIVAALSRQEYIVAWDGLGAPDVSAIPAGVTVTYSGTPYTGTLAASASTVNKIYMVWNGAAYDMYGTSQDGGYTWVPMGTTSVNLSQYATKEEFDRVSDIVNNLVIGEQTNLLYGASKTSGYVYRHSNGTIDPVESASIYDDGIPVVAGEKLYYKNLYPFFSGIKKTSDNSWVAMSDNTVWNASGEYEVPADGLLFITMNNFAPDHQLLTRDKTMYDDDIIESSIELNPITKIGNINSDIDDLKGDVDTLNTRVAGVENEVEDIIIKRVNLLEDADKTSGYVYAHESGAINSVESASIYDDGIPVVAGETLYFKNLYPFFCGIKKSSDNTWVAMSNSAGWNASGEYLVPADGLLYISINNAAPDHQLLTRDKIMYDDDIIESYEEINPEMLPDVGEKVFYIGSTREYTTLRAGIAEAIRHKNAVVYVDPETFDLTQEFSAEIAAEGTIQYGIELGNGVHIIFSPGAVVNALYQGTVQNVVRYFAPFYSGITNGGFTLEGLTIYAKNTRYCVHDEYGGANVITRNRYINCKMVYDGSTSPYDYFQNCIGGGTAKHSYVEIVNCYFDTTGTMTDPSTVSYHNANVAGAKNTIIVSNCYFAHGTFRLGYYGPSTLISRAFVNNCSFEVAPIKRAENETALIDNWELLSFLNEIRG